MTDTPETANGERALLPPSVRESAEVLVTSLEKRRDNCDGPTWTEVEFLTEESAAACDDLRAALSQSPTGSSICPLCGLAEPHEHFTDRKGNVLVESHRKRFESLFSIVLQTRRLQRAAEQSAHHLGADPTKLLESEYLRLSADGAWWRPRHLEMDGYEVQWVDDAWELYKKTLAKEKL